MKRRTRYCIGIGLGALLLGLFWFGIWKWSSPLSVPPSLREVLRDQLELRDGILYARGEDKPFQGKLVENYDAGRRKLEIDIGNGKANGVSRGWYDNGQLEVEETFRDGVSQGQRTRWYDKGQRRSLARIENGKVTGEFLEWYPNGRLATRMTLVNGQPEGLVEAWHPSGALKSRIQFEHGQRTSRQFFDDPVPVAASR